MIDSFPQKYISSHVHSDVFTTYVRRQSRLQLPPETEISTHEQICRSLLDPAHVAIWAEILRERSESTGGELLLLTMHQHSGKVGEFQALGAVNTALNSLNHWLWRDRGGQKGCWLSPAASDFMCLGISVPETDSAGRWHTHTLLAVPATPGGEVVPHKDLLGALSRYTDASGVKRHLHLDAVHVQRIHCNEELGPIVAYMTKGWRDATVPRLIDLVPTTTHSHSIRENWSKLSSVFTEREVEERHTVDWLRYECNARYMLLCQEFNRRLTGKPNLGPAVVDGHSLVAPPPKPKPHPRGAAPLKGEVGWGDVPDYSRSYQRHRARSQVRSHQST